MTSLHIFGPTTHNSVRIRAYCPICEKQRYGRYTLYYDQTVAILECGFCVQSEAPIRGHYGPRGGHPIWRRIPRFKEWGWDWRAWIKRVPVKAWD